MRQFTVRHWTRCSRATHLPGRSLFRRTEASFTRCVDHNMKAEREDSRRRRFLSLYWTAVIVLGHCLEQHNTGSVRQAQRRPRRRRCQLRHASSDR